MLGAARKAVDDLKVRSLLATDRRFLTLAQVENVGLTQALATEQAARIKDREAYQVNTSMGH